MKIENRLKELASTNPNYSLLLAQWEFDKKLLTRALNTVGRDFPHYSLHDATHSSTIINQIEKIISKDINKLSATDCWLILESCYWHDSGMLIADHEKMDLLRSSDFLAYTHYEKQNNTEIAEFIRIYENDIDSNNPSVIYEKSRALTFVIADFYRRQHAERSRTYVLDPESIKIMSPRTYLIPSRLFSFVAEIAAFHGKSRENISSIAKCNDGMDSEDYAHPRYIAALLRLGDLLDIDDGRFCQTMLANVGNVPSSSLAHQHKHASIKHLQIDSNTIEIKSICPDYDSFEAQSQWFEYLKSEIRYQRENWDDISPDPSYSSLPIIKNLTCEIDGYIDIDGKAPKLRLFNQRIYEYLSSNILYSEKFPYIRESVQNSIDTIFYKVWEENSIASNWHEKSGDIDREQFENKLNSEKINITLTRLSIDEKNINYSIEINDTGLGITLDNIKKILNVGSFLNEKLLRQRLNMPDWAKPSGYFGLGMQSIFKMPKSAEIHTRTKGGEQYKIYSSLKDNGSVNLKIKKAHDNINIGTTLKIFFDYVKIPDSISQSQIEFLKLYDPVKDDILEILPSIIEEILTSNFATCPVPIIFNGTQINHKDTDKVISTKPRHSNYELGIDFDLFIDLDKRSRSYFAYKGVPFESKIKPEGVYGVYDIFSKDAAYWLTIDRKKQNETSTEELHKNLNSLLIKEYKKIIENTTIKEDAELYFYTIFKKEDCILWGDSIFNDIKIKDYLSGKEKLVISNLHEGMNEKSTFTPINIWHMKATLLGKLIIRKNISIVISLLESKEYVIHNTKSNFQTYNIEFIDDGKQSVTIEESTIKLWINKNRQTGCSRSTIPLFNEKYIDISLNDDEVEKWMYCHTDFHGWFSRVLLLPSGKRSIELDLEDIYIYYNKNKKLSLDKIQFKKLYKELWQDLDCCY
ncbi:TPA: hypothetical protein MAL41_001257 [Klebsiella aerogenes]|nr:hypothetical protein [Klebsiella aerogenes]